MQGLQEAPTCWEQESEKRGGVAKSWGSILVAGGSKGYALGWVYSLA